MENLFRGARSIRRDVVALYFAGDLAARGEVTGLERYEDLGPDLYALEKVKNVLVEHADAAV